MSTIVFSNQSSILLLYLQWASIKYRRTLDQKIAAVPHIILNRQIVQSTMAKTKITLRAKHPDKTETFITAVQTVMDIFDDEVSFLMQDTRLKAYKNLVRSYKAALTSVWDLAQFADVNLVLKSVEDKEMCELAIMTQKLNPPDPET